MVLIFQSPWNLDAVLLSSRDDDSEKSGQMRKMLKGTLPLSLQFSYDGAFQRIKVTGVRSWPGRGRLVLALQTWLVGYSKPALLIQASR